MNIRPIAFDKVKIQSSFWSPRLDTINKVTVPVCLDQCERTGRLDNFRKSAGKKEGGFRGIFFDDSDVYKVLEGAAYSLLNCPNPELEKRVDDCIADICAAQQPDGYIYNYYTLNTPEKRWTDMDMHEDYCLGHMLEAGIAYKQATGKSALLDCAVRGVKQMMSVFGPGKRDWVPGHEEIELALVRLYHLTGEKEYLEFAKWLIGERGHGHFVSERQRTEHHLPIEYYQDAKPFEQMEAVSGHAVRAMYYFTGIADIISCEENEVWRKTLEKIWNNLCPGNTYLTGGIGQCCDNEGFSHDWDKPSLTAYCETCAAIGAAMWSQRMNTLSGDARYADLVEREIYNGALSGLSLSGDKFFYQNPLASLGNHHRVPWFGCSCCPTNLCRFIPSIGGYAYAQDEKTLYINQFIGGTLDTERIRLQVETEYPYKGNVVFKVLKSEFDELSIRIPGWCKNYTLNGASYSEKDGYILTKAEEGAVIAFDMEMLPRRVYDDVRVSQNRGRVAVARGPVVYCAEETDNPGMAAEYFHADAALAKDAALEDGKWDETLQALHVKAGTLDLIPYAVWENRDASAMSVWLKEC